MPRQPRPTLAGQAHHVIQRSNNRQAIFFSDVDRRFFLSELGDAMLAYGCSPHAYVLMINHNYAAADDGIGRLMQSMGRRYVGHVHNTAGTKGNITPVPLFTKTAGVKGVQPATPDELPKK